MIVDTSVLLAVFFNEPAGPWCAEKIEEHRSLLKMSTVNLAELLILLEDRQPQLFEAIREQVFSSSIQFVAPSVSQAHIAAKARLRYPLNLGDCFVYALAQEENAPILTLDAAFKKTDQTIIMPPARLF